VRGGAGGDVHRPAMANEWKGEAADAARQAAARRETGGAKGPGDLRAPGTSGKSAAEEPEERRSGVVPEPEPEDVPELLGERSDYPISRGDDDGER
jgi:hypothetical protein